MLLTLADATPATCGGKAGPLGALTRAGLPVPAGVVVPLDVHRAATDVLDLPQVAARAGADAARRLVGSRPLPPALVTALAGALAHLGDGPVAVRSSATTEDTATDSAAGQHATVLGVRGVDAVAGAVRACWASAWSDRAVAYRRARGAAADPGVAVLVQRHVDADVAGVLFTGTRTGSGDDAVVEASWGLGCSVVGGAVNPDRWTVTARGELRRELGDKATRVDRGPGGTVIGDVPAAMRGRPCLDDAEVGGVVTLGREVARVVGEARDVEWALAGGDLWLLQARPVTAALPGGRPASADRGDLLAGRDLDADLLAGTPGSRGRAAGPARLVHWPADFARVRPGDVLVCRFTDPAWTPLFTVVAGVVTETGGVLSHAAIVAREHGLPAVLGVPGALAALGDGEVVEVDGAAGTVRRSVRQPRRDGWSRSAPEPRRGA